MAPEVAEVLKSAKSLERGQIADLAYQLLVVLDDVAATTTQTEVDASWRSEFRRRIDEIETGEATLVDHAETVAEARALLMARRV